MKIDFAMFYDFIETQGFSKLYVGGLNSGATPIFIQKQGFIVKRCTKENIIEYSYSYIKKLRIEKDIKDAIRNAFHSSGSKFTDNNLATIDIASIPFKKDTDNQAFLYYKNGFVEVNSKEIRLRPYEELNGYLWESEMINREFIYREFESVKTESNFYKFLKDVCTHENKFVPARLRSLLSIIGYVLHGYKDPSNPRAIILMDKDQTENPQGGTGKSLIIESLRQIRTSLVFEDGKRLKTDGRFEWANVERDTRIVAVDDLRKQFKIEHLFSMISNEMAIEKKNQDKFSFPYKDSPKFIFSTNYVIQGVGHSYARRMVEFELSDYYNENITPYTKFNESFFEDRWSVDQWRLFDNFMVYALQRFLLKGIIMPKYLNVILRKSIQATNEDFVEFFKSEIEFNKEYNKHNLYLKFTKYSQDYGNIKQYTFTLWLKEYSLINGLKVMDRKSGNNRFITIAKSNKE